MSGEDRPILELDYLLPSHIMVGIGAAIFSQKSDFRYEDSQRFRKPKRLQQ